MKEGNEESLKSKEEAIADLLATLKSQQAEMKLRRDKTETKQGELDQSKPLGLLMCMDQPPGSLCETMRIASCAPYMPDANLTNLINA